MSDEGICGRSGPSLSWRSVWADGPAGCDCAVNVLFFFPANQASVMGAVLVPSHSLPYMPNIPQPQPMTKTHLQTSRQTAPEISTTREGVGQRLEKGGSGWGKGYTGYKRKRGERVTIGHLAGRQLAFMNS